MSYRLLLNYLPLTCLFLLNSTIFSSSLPTTPIRKTEMQSSESDCFSSRAPQRRFTFPLIDKHLEKLPQKELATKPIVSQRKILKEYRSSQEKAQNHQYKEELLKVIEQLKKYLKKEYESYLKGYEQQALENVDLAHAAEPMSFEVFKANNSSLTNAYEKLAILETINI